MEWALTLFILFIGFIFYNLPNNNKPSTSFALKIKELFGADIRSLAIFRIVLALTIIKDLLLRASDLKAHYTDEGIFPRVLALLFNDKWFFSFHLLNGTKETQAALFIISGIIAFFLLVGYRTKLVTFLSWLFLISLQHRNVVVNDVGDAVLRLVLFWSMFLPLGACYSLDSALNSSSKPIPKQILSFGVVGFFLQICFLYWFSAYEKLQNAEWKNGTAIFYTLNLITDVTPIGIEISKLPISYLKLLNHCVLSFEALGPLLLFSPIYTTQVRFIVLLSFTLLQIGFGLCLNIGLINWIGLFAMLPFIPRELWERIFNNIKISKGLNLKIYYDGECGFCKKMVLIIRTFFLIPEAQLIPAQDDPLINRAMEENNSWVIIDQNGNQHLKFKAFIVICQASPLLNLLVPFMQLDFVESLGRNLYETIAVRRKMVSKVNSIFTYSPITTPTQLENVIAALLITYVFAWNIWMIAPKYKIPDKLTWIGALLNIDQKWVMYIPATTWHSGWPVLAGKLKDGTEIDLFTKGKEITWDKPSVPTLLYKNRHWKRYLINTLSDDRYKVNYTYLGLYACNEWNRTHKDEKQLEGLDFYWIGWMPQPDYKFKELKLFKWKTYCLEQTGSAEEIIKNLEDKYQTKEALSPQLYAAAHYHLKEGDYAKASKIYTKALEVHEQITGKEHPSVVEVLELLSSLHNYLGNHEEVEKLNTRVREIRKKQ